MNQGDLRRAIGELEHKILTGKQDFTGVLDALSLEPRQLVGRRVMGLSLAKWKLVISTYDGRFCAFALNEGYEEGDQSIEHTRVVSSDELKAAGLPITADDRTISDLEKQRDSLVARLNDYDRIIHVLKSADMNFLLRVIEHAQARIDASRQDSDVKA